MTTWFALYYSKPILDLDHPTILCASRFSVPLDSLCLSIHCASRFTVPLDFLCISIFCASRISILCASRFTVPLDSLCLSIHCASQFSVLLDSPCLLSLPERPSSLNGTRTCFFLQHLQLKLGFSLLLHRICI